MMGKIILPEDLKPKPEELAYDKWLMEVYESNPELKAAADKLHDSRMGPGNACHQCIEIAMKQLKWKINPEWIAPNDAT